MRGGIIGFIAANRIIALISVDAGPLADKFRADEFHRLIVHVAKRGHDFRQAELLCELSRMAILFFISVSHSFEYKT